MIHCQDEKAAALSRLCTDFLDRPAFEGEKSSHVSKSLESLGELARGCGDFVAACIPHWCLPQWWLLALKATFFVVELLM